MSELPADKFDWVGTILTVDGVAANVLNLSPKDITLNDVAHSLSMICRYNGHVPTFYSVAEHSVRVASLLETNGHPRNVVLTGLLHDASETYVGDMVRPLKRHPDFGATHQEVEARVAAACHQALGGTFPHPDAVHDADQAIYRWEVENIRSGAVIGWTHSDAKARWLALYHRLNHPTPKDAA